MTNPHFRQITDYRDVESLNMFAELNAQGRDAEELLAILASKSRDNSRTPMQWDGSKHAGFTQGEPWIALCGNATDINVAAALDDADSVFYTYQKLIALRKTEPVITGRLPGSVTRQPTRMVLSARMARTAAAGHCQPE